MALPNISTYFYVFQPISKDFQSLIITTNQNILTVKPILYLFLNEMGSKNTIPIPNSLDSQEILIFMKLPVSEDALSNDMNFNRLPIFPMLLNFAADYLESLGALHFVNRMITWGQSICKENALLPSERSA